MMPTVALERLQRGGDGGAASFNVEKALGAGCGRGSRVEQAPSFQFRNISSEYDKVKGNEEGRVSWEVPGRQPAYIYVRMKPSLWSPHQKACSNVRNPSHA